MKLDGIVTSAMSSLRRLIQPPALREGDGVRQLRQELELQALAVAEVDREAVHVRDISEGVDLPLGNSLTELQVIDNLLNAGKLTTDP